MLSFNARCTAPITSLPPEILEEIFKICISWLYQPPFPPRIRQKHPHEHHHDHHSHLAWTQVCSSWRLISLSSPRLWRTIDLASSPHFAEECLKRSKRALIDIISSTSAYAPLRPFSCDKNDHDDPHAAVLPHVLSSLRAATHRIRSINLFLFPNDMYHLFHTTLSALPNLTSLTLKLPPLSKPIMLPLSLTLGRVKQLSLEGVALAHNSWTELRELRYLSLKGLDEESCPSVKELLEILERSPELEYLRLEDWRPSGTDDSITCNKSGTDHDAIHLRRLQLLTISSSQNILASLFSSSKFHLILNPHARIRLFVSLSDDLCTIFRFGRMPWAACDTTINGVDRDRTSSLELKPVRLSLAPADQVHDRTSSGSGRNGNALLSSVSSIDSIQTIRLSKNGTHFLASDSPTWFTDSQNQSETQSPILFSLSSARPVGTHICASLPHLLGSKLGWITKLELNTGVLSSSTEENNVKVKENGIPEDALRTLFENLPGLETLCVAFNDLAPLWNVLIPQHSSEDCVSRRILAPRLSSLSFSKSSELWWRFSERWLGSVIEFVKSRSTSQVLGDTLVQPIQAVEFLRCQGITQPKEGEKESEEMSELRSLVPVVVVQEEVGRKNWL